jgi:Mg2+/Co2+ transporter CorB
MLFSLSIIILLLFCSAFFSGSETALTASSRAKIHKLKSEGDKRASRVAKLLKNKDRLISTILLGNNLVNIAASALATALAIEFFGDEGIIYVTIILTLVVLIFAEVLPKTYAFNNAEKVALFVSAIFSLIIKILTPITFVVEGIVKFFIKLFRLDSSEGVANVMHGTEALKGAIELHHEEGDVIKDDKDMLGSILELSNTEVYHSMKHRKDMETIDLSLSSEEIFNKVVASSYTRIPVYDGDQDNIVGILHGKDLMRAFYNDAKGDATKLNIRDVIKEPWFVPDSTKLKDQLLAFKEKHNHFALVVDEYGSLQGLITLEDILEEIVGNIEDEYDIDFHVIEENIDGSYVIDASIPIRDLNREMDWDLPYDDANTIAGLIINTAEIIPQKGQIFNFHGFRFEIIQRKNNQITKVRINKIK